MVGGFVFGFSNLPLPDQDNAEPSANSIAVRNLYRLGRLLADKSLLDQASAIVHTFASRLNEHPYVLPSMTAAFMRREAKLVAFST